MSRVNHNGYFDSTTEDELYELKKELNAQRIKDFKSGEYELGGGVVDPLPEDAPLFVIIPFDKMESFFREYLK